MCANLPTKISCIQQLAKLIFIMFSNSVIILLLLLLCALVLIARFPDPTHATFCRLQYGKSSNRMPEIIYDMSDVRVERKV